MSNNYVYYTALINNDGSRAEAYESEIEPAFEFRENRKIPLLPNPEEYEVAVQSCLIDLKTLPVFVPTINIIQTQLIYKKLKQFMKSL